jgi:hypothetical protein
MYGNHYEVEILDTDVNAVLDALEDSTLWHGSAIVTVEASDESEARASIGRLLEDVVDDYTMLVRAI